MGFSDDTTQQTPCWPNTLHNVVVTSKKGGNKHMPIVTMNGKRILLDPQGVELTELCTEWDLQIADLMLGE